MQLTTSHVSTKQQCHNICLATQAASEQVEPKDMQTLEQRLWWWAHVLDGKLQLLGKPRHAVELLVSGDGHHRACAA